MKIKSLVIIALLVSCPLSLLADELYDYTETLVGEFTVIENTKLIKVSSAPRLLEKDFTIFLIDAFEKDESKKEIVAKWRPIQKKMLAEGYVFEIEFELKNKNLDSGIEVNLVGDMINKITLANNLGEYAAMYKFTGGKSSSLNFMNPKIKLLCFFNTKTEQGKPLLRKGVTSLDLNVKQLAENIPDMSLKWAVPLSYFSVKRPAKIKALFGNRQLRTLRTYKTQVYHKSTMSAIPHIKRIKRKEKTDEEDEE